MTMPGTDKGMRDFMQNGVANMRLVRVAHIMARQGNFPLSIVALTGPPSRMIQSHAPLGKTMRLHERGGKLQRRLQRPCRDVRRAVS